MLSVIIPAYNEEKYIEQTLKALPENIEKIVVCNACTDNTAGIAKKYARVIETEIKGVSHARNLGAKNASHEKLVFLDADIIVDNNTIQEIINTNVDIGTTLAKANSTFKFDKFLMWLKSKTHRFGLNTGIIFCTKEIFNKVGGFNENLSIQEDGTFQRACKKIGNHKVLNVYVYNNMRRYRRIGYINLTKFWLKHLFFKKEKIYESIR